MTRTGGPRIVPGPRLAPAAALALPLALGGELGLGAALAWDALVVIGAGLEGRALHRRVPAVERLSLIHI